MYYTEIFAAKSNKEGKWESVLRHADDTAGVMDRLCDMETGFVSPAFAVATGLEPAVLKKTCVFIAAVHDIAKITPGFQWKIWRALPGLGDRLASYGFGIRTGAHWDGFEHAFISGAILHEIYGADSSVCDVVAAHHGTPRRMGREYTWKHPLKHNAERIFGSGGEFKRAWDELVAFAEERAEIRCGDLPELSLRAQILLSGLLMTADWIASNEYFFPLYDVWETRRRGDEYRAARGYEACGVKRGWYPQAFAYDAGLFRERFRFHPNETQAAAGRAVNGGAKLVIIEALMGKGKTEAALMAAEVMAAVDGCGGMFIGLPTQATSNGMFGRLIPWAEKVSGGLGASINLAHGGASFNEDLKRLKANTCDSGGLTVNGWMAGRHRALMSDFVDGTIDQAAAMALNRKFFMMLHMQAAGKVFIFDEIHSYDDYTNSYIGTMLSYLGLYGCPVILLSATLRNELREMFVQAYTGDRNLHIARKDLYPCVTWWEGKALHEDAVPVSESDRSRIRIKKAQDTDLADMIGELLSDGGCAGVIRNTVKEAVRTYEELREKLGDGYRIILVHSRFLMGDRAEKESEIIRLTGAGSTDKDRDRLVIVGTQVLEESLDYDVDVLFTDPCPMDALFQRLGRLQRHIRKRLSLLIKKTAFLIMKGEAMAGSGGYPYMDYVMNRTVELIQEAGGTLTFPDDIKPMTEKTYDLSLTPESEEKDEYRKKVEDYRNTSRYTRIREPEEDGILRGYLDDAYTADEGSVRAGNDSSEVLLLKKKDGMIMDVRESAKCAAGCLPDAATGDVFLRQVIRLPGHMIPWDDLEKMKAATGFGNESPWKYKAILLLDEEDSYTVRGKGKDKTYHYSSVIGLTETCAVPR